MANLYSGIEKISPAPGSYDQKYTNDSVGKINRVLSRLNSLILSATTATSSGSEVSSYDASWSYWTPTITPSTGMVIGQVTYTSHQYLAGSSYVDFDMIVSVNINGILGSEIQFSLPVVAVGYSTASCSIYNNYGAWVPGVAIIGPNLTVMPTASGMGSPTNAVFGLGQQLIYVSGRYRTS